MKAFVFENVTVCEKRFGASRVCPAAFRPSGNAREPSEMDEKLRAVVRAFEFIAGRVSVSAHAVVFAGIYPEAGKYGSRLWSGPQ